MKYGNIQILRCIATVLVVLFHSLGCYTYGWNFCSTKIMVYEYFDLFINQINMPLFTCISGYLFCKSIENNNVFQTSTFIWKKFKRLIIPYIIWTLIQLLIFPATTQIEMLWDGGCLHLWFLLMLFIIFIVFSVTKQFWTTSNNKNIIFLILLLLAPIWLWIPNIMCIESAWSMSVYFLLGIMIVKLPKFEKWLPLIIICMFGALLLLADTIYCGREPMWYNMIIRRISSLILVGFLIPLVGIIVEKKTVDSNPIIQSLDNCSMGIYILHHIFLWWFVQLDCLKALIETHYVMMPFLMWVISLSLSWYITSIIKRTHVKFILG